MNRSSVLIRPFSEIFLKVPDHRHAKGKRHDLSTVLNVVLVGLINQQNSIRQIAEWARGLNRQTGQRLGFRRGKAPSYSTIERVLRGLDTTALAGQIEAWVEEVLAGLGHSIKGPHLAVDGKTLRGSGDQEDGMPAVQMLNVMVHQLGATLTSWPIAGQSHESRSVKALLEALVLTGRVITVDAIATQREVAETVLKKGSLPDAG